MRTKRLLIALAGVLGGMLLLAGLIAGAIAGIIFYSVGHSDAAATAREYLRRNEKLKRDVGPVREFGSLVTGGLNARNAEGDATLKLKVMGEQRTVKATVVLAYNTSGKWQVTDASYLDERGGRVDLMGKYDAAPSPPPAAEEDTP
jgi:hypothetical protein